MVSLFKHHRGAYLLRISGKKLFVMLLALIVASVTATPVEDLDPGTIAIEYNGLMSGQTARPSDLSMTVRAHYLMLRYAPAPWILASVGAGSSQLSIPRDFADPFDGGHSVSGAFALHFFTPPVWGRLMFTTGADGLLLNGKDGIRKSVSMIISPGAGARLLTCRFFDVQAGVKGPWFSRDLRKLRRWQQDSTSVQDPLRGYLSASLHSPDNGAWAVFGFDVSPDASFISSDNMRGVSFSMRIGHLLRLKETNFCAGEMKRQLNCFRGYDTMKKQEAAMARDIKKRKPSADGRSGCCIQTGRGDSLPADKPDTSGVVGADAK